MIRALVLATLAVATLQKEYEYTSDSTKGNHHFKQHPDPPFIEIKQWEYKILPGQASAELIFPDEYFCYGSGIQYVLPVVLSVEVLSDEEPASINIDPALKEAVIYRTTDNATTLGEALVNVKAYCFSLINPPP